MASRAASALFVEMVIARTRSFFAVSPQPGGEIVFEDATSAHQV